MIKPSNTLFKAIFSVKQKKIIVINALKNTLSLNNGTEKHGLKIFIMYVKEKKVKNRSSFCPTSIVRSRNSKLSHSIRGFSEKRSTKLPLARNIR